MNNYPLPQEEDPNVLVDQEIMDRLFDERFDQLLDRENDQYNYEMLPYLSPDDKNDER